MRTPPVQSLKDLLKYIRRSSSGLERLKMIGIIFARPNNELTKTEILPHIGYYNIRTGDSIDIFFAGYSGGDDGDDIDLTENLSKTDAHQQVDLSDSTQFLRFSAVRFNAMRKEFEDKTSWQYSGETDLILVDTSLDANDNVKLDFGSSVAFNFEKAKEVKAIRSVEAFIEELSRWSENNVGKGTWELAQKEFKETGRSFLSRIILSIMPDEIKASADRVNTFMHVDLRKY